MNASSPKLASAIALALWFATASLIFGAHAHEGHSHEHQRFSAGVPGDPDRPSRTVQVVMREIGAKMAFVPDRLAVRQGEQIHFKIRNAGKLEHEFVLATTEDNLQHEKAMRAQPAMEHHDANMLRLKPGTAGDLLWRFTKAGVFEFACLIPGHREAGMLGRVTVK
ncbi:MAG TPA: cupredoxin family protein [Woeseiaceae bacterium]|nr:cupredoxin family protein [Woeseiaceae bacterium]